MTGDRLGEYTGFGESTSPLAAVAPLRDIAVVRRWIAAGFDFDRATRWTRAWGEGQDPAVLGAWLTAGFGAKASRAWSLAGVEPDEALEWRTLGCDVEDAALFGSLDVVHRWLELGFTLTQARRWRAIGGIARPADAAAWRAIGCGPAGAERWLTVPGVHNPADATFWIEHGCRPKEARRWLAIRGMVGRAAVERWIDSGMRLELVRQWGEVLEGALDDSSAWVAEGYGPKEASRWLAVPSIYGVGEVLPWRRIGIGPAPLARWMKAFNRRNVGMRLSPERLLEWAYAGCSSKQAARCEATGLAPVDVLRLAEQGIGVDDAPSTVGFERPVPPRGRNVPFVRTEETRPSVACLEGSHEHCDRPKACRCGCHCWHDERRFDHRLQGPEAGWYPPRLIIGSGHARRCRSRDPERHGLCRAGSRCGCACHCWHEGLIPQTLDTVRAASPARNED